jgi:hypothetical protein
LENSNASFLSITIGFVDYCQFPSILVDSFKQWFQKNYPTLTTSSIGLAYRWSKNPLSTPAP